MVAATTTAFTTTPTTINAKNNINNSKNKNNEEIRQSKSDTINGKNGTNNISSTPNMQPIEITYALFETDLEALTDVNMNDQVPTQPTKKGRLPYIYVWRNIVAMIGLHALAILAILTFPEIKWQTGVWTAFILLMGSMGVQAGAHRLWAHRTYKANLGVRIFLSLWHVLALQNDLYEWSRDHRAHHKFSDTDADPHDSSKGFFFSHVGWLLVKKHPEVIRRGKTLDMSDLEADPVVMFQRKFYIPMVALFWGFIPAMVPYWFWNETLYNSVMVCVFFRYVLSLNLTWLVNSWAHMYGNRPYDKKIASVEASIRHVLMGEGFHNYHHSFPWDYSASEYGAFDVFNPATALINFFHYMGWAWDLKKVNPEMIAQKKLRTGDKAYYDKRHTAFVEQFTGLLVLMTPICLMLLPQYFANTDIHIN